MNEINFSASNIANLAALQFGAVEDGAKSDKGLGAKDLLTVTTAAVAPMEGIEEVPEAALTRDDALGQHVRAAFNLPAPPMPLFRD